MASPYKPGDIAYIVESSHFLREVKIIKIAGGIATLRFTNTVGGIKVSERRLFPTKEAAINSMPRKTAHWL